MEKYLNFLKNCPLFFQIEDNSLLKMLNCLGARIESFDKKHTVMAEGNPAKLIGILLSGSAQIERIDYYGNRSLISEIVSGDVFCEAFACAELSSVPVSVVTNEASEVMLIDCDHILHTCSNNCGFHQQLIFNLMKDLAGKTIVYHQKLEIMSKRTTREKLLAYLDIQARKFGSNCFVIPFDRQELADYLEVDRSGLSNEISKLRSEGIVKSERNYFELL